MKKILVVITTAFVPYGGLTTVAMNYYRNIDQNEYHMDFASSNSICSKLDKELKANGSKYYHMPKRTKQLMAYYKQLKRICSLYDIIHIHANSATASLELLAAKHAGVNKRIVHIHNTRTDHIIFHNLLKPIFNHLYTNAIACSRSAGEWIFKDFIILNNAIDSNKYKYDVEKRQKIRRKYGIRDNEIIIGHVGKMVEQKNHMFLLDIIYALKDRFEDCRFILVGDGMLHDRIIKRAIELGVENKIIYTGIQNDASMFYSAMDLFVFPSLWEGLGMVIIEAQANGLKCVISSCVPAEVDMGGTIRISLLEDANSWANLIVNNLNFEKSREKQSEQYCKNITANGYEIKSNVAALSRIYST